MGSKKNFCFLLVIGLFCIILLKDGRYQYIFAYLWEWSSSERKNHDTVEQRP